MGERRFKAPEYVDASDRVFEAKYYGKSAYTTASYSDVIQKLASEDCLYLNIWANADDKTEKKPVMVWIHGGAYSVGSGSQFSYNGRAAKPLSQRPATACSTRRWRSGGCTRTSPLSAATLTT